MEKIKLLLVEDRDIIRDSIKLLFQSIEDIEIVGEATDGLEALYQAQNIKYDVILMDYSMPEMNGFEALKHILEINPNARIVMFSFFDNPFGIRKMLEAGAYGYILKDSDLDIYVSAIRTVDKGGKFLCENSKKILKTISVLN